MSRRVLRGPGRERQGLLQDLRCVTLHESILAGTERVRRQTATSRNQITAATSSKSPACSDSQGYFPYHARVSSQAMTTAPPSASTARSAPAAMLQIADRRHAHHMKQETSAVSSAALTTTRSPESTRDCRAAVPSG